MGIIFLCSGGVTNLWLFSSKMNFFPIWNIIMITNRPNSVKNRSKKNFTDCFDFGQLFLNC